MAPQIELLRRGGRIRPTQAALAGGNLPALGYVAPGQLTPAAAQVYNGLTRAGELPQRALSIAKKFDKGGVAGLNPAEKAAIGAAVALVGAFFFPPLLLGELGAIVGVNLAFLGGGGAAAIPGSSSAPRRTGIGRAVPHVELPNPQNELARQMQQNYLRNLNQGVQEIPQAVQRGVQLANQIGPYLPAPFGGNNVGQIPVAYTPPGPGPDGQPQAGQTSQGVPILDQETACATCGDAGAALEMARGPVLSPPQPGTDDANLPAPQPGDFAPPGSSNVAEIPPAYSPTGDFTRFQPPNPFENQPGYNPDGTPIAPGPQGGGGFLIPPGPQGGGGSNLDVIHQLQDQLQQEIQTEQNQLQQEQQHNLELNRIGQQIQQLRDLERTPPDQRDIPSELAMKRGLQAQLQNLENQIMQPGPQGQPRSMPSRPTPTPPGSQPRAPELPPADQSRPPGGQGQHPAQPVQFCVGCQSSEDAILFLNGEPAACSVMPGSTQPIPGA